MKHLTLDEKNALLEYAFSLIEKEIHLHESQKANPPGWWARRKLNKAAKIFGFILENDNGNWSSMWALGKIYQRFLEHEIALAWFHKAFELQPNNPDVCREAGLAAMEIGLADEAIHFCEAAVSADENDPGLVTNLALAYLIANRIDDSIHKANEAVSRSPEDDINQYVLALVNYVRAGILPVPRSIPELMESASKLQRSQSI